MYVKTQVFFVLGISKSGFAAAEYILKRGGRCFIYEEHDSPRIAEAAEKLLSQGAERVTGEGAEAAAEIVHARIRETFWGYETEPHPSIEEMLKNRYRGIRPAPGYPTLPDHTLKREILDLLGAREACGMTLTENFMMVPQSSVCALVLANPEARCFTVGKIADDQLEEYAERRGFPVDKLKQWIS